MSEDFEVDYDASGESTASELKEIHDTLTDILSAIQSRTDLWRSFWIVNVLIMLFASWPGSKLDRWTDKIWYSAKYDAYTKNIAVGKRPQDCDFFHAPIGDKACDYEKKTQVFGDEERKALMQQAATPDERKHYAQEPNSVTVYWDKTEE
jgi:hypothetical protein